MESSKQVGITEVVVRDGIQSLLATRVPLRDLVSILPALDKVGYWSLETWGGATSVSYTHLTLPTNREV